MASDELTYAPDPAQKAQGNEDDDREFATIDELRKWHGENVRFRNQWKPEADWLEGMVHGYQWTPQQERELAAQGRQPVKSNHLSKVINSMTGFRAQNKYEIKVLPVGSGDGGNAYVRTMLTKHVWDQNEVEYSQSDCALNQYTGPMGWFFVGVQTDDPSKETAVIEWVPWKEMAWDPAMGVSLNMAKAENVTRQRWVPLRNACLDWPEHAIALKQFATNQQEQRGQTQNSNEFGMPVIIDNGGDRVGPISTWGPDKYYYAARKEVLLVEVWYRRKMACHWLALPDGRNVEFDAKNQQHQLQNLMKPDSVTSGFCNRVYMATFCGDVLLEEKASPYKHEHFPYVPMWGLKDQKGFPYGITRLIEDEQMVINWTTSKLLWMAGSRQAYAGPQADIENISENLAKPDGIVTRMNKDDVEIIPQGDMMALNEALLQNALNNVKEIGGSPAEARGQDGKKTSGKAILATQDAALRQQGRFLDNEQRALVMMGKILNAIFDQYYTDEKILRITKAGVGQSDKQVAFNVQDPLRRHELEQQGIEVYGPIGQEAYDVTITTAPLSSTEREALREQLNETLAGLDPETRMMLMDLQVDASDYPNKEEIVKRVQEIQQHRQQGPAPEKPRESMAVSFGDMAEWAQDQILERDFGLKKPPGASNVPVKEQVKHMGAAAQLGHDTAVKAQEAQLQQQQQAHEQQMQAQDHQHDAGMGAMGHGQAMQAKGVDQMHQADMAQMGHGQNLEAQQQAADLAPEPQMGGGDG